MLLLALAVVGVVTILLAGAAHARRDPAWWREPEVSQAAELRGESFEHAVLAQLTRVRETNAAWSVSLSESDVNAWLATRLRPWLANRNAASKLPADVTVQVQFQAGGMLAGVRTRGEVIWCEVVPVVSDGKLRLDVRSAAVGRLPVPIAQVAGRLASDSELSDLLAGKALAEAAVKVDGKRQVEIETLELQDGELVVKARTKVLP